MSHSVETDVTSSKSQQLECEEKQEHQNVQLQTTKNIKANNENLTGSNENSGNDMRVSEETEETRELLRNNSEMKGTEDDLQVKKSVTTESKVGLNVVLLHRKSSSMEFSSSVALLSERSIEKGN